MVKKKKKVVSQSPQVSKIAQRLVYLTGIPHDATEQEVTDLVGSFGKIKNILLMPCSEEEIEKGEGQKVLFSSSMLLLMEFVRNFTFSCLLNKINEHKMLEWIEYILGRVCL